MARKPEPAAEAAEPRIAAGAAMMTGTSGVGGAPDAGDLSRRMANAHERALALGLTAEERSKAVDEAILKFQRGEPE